MELWLNRGDDKVPGLAPINPAFHPYFACRDGNRVVVRCGGGEHRGFSDKARAVPLTSKTIIIEMLERKIEMRLGGAFKTHQSRLVFWSDAPSRYVCVEPVLKDKNLFDTPAGIALGVGQDIEMSMTLRVLQAE
jgi:hypothetical protein